MTFKYPKDNYTKTLIEEVILSVKEDALNNPVDVVADEAWLEACEDCLYAVGLSMTAFEQHVEKWYSAVVQPRSDREYVNAIQEIVDNINKELTQ